MSIRKVPVQLYKLIRKPYEHLYDHVSLKCCSLLASKLFNDMQNVGMAHLITVVKCHDMFLVEGEGSN